MIYILIAKIQKRTREHVTYSARGPAREGNRSQVMGIVIPFSVLYQEW